MRLRLAQIAVLLSGVGANQQDAEPICGLLSAVLDYAGWDPGHEDSGPPGTVLAVAGSGKKGVSTANISTAAAFVTAAAGVQVVKCVSSAASSTAGSADTLEAAGVPLASSPSEAAVFLSETGIAFMRIESLIERFDAVYGGTFLAPHALSLGLPAMLAPGWATHIFYGLAHANVVTSASAISKMRPRARVTVAASTTSDSTVWVDEVAGEHVRTATAWQTDGVFHTRSVDVGASDADVRALGIPDSRDRPQLLQALAEGRGPDAIQMAVLATATQYILCAEAAATPTEARARAGDAIRSGRAAQQLYDSTLQETTAAAPG